MLCFVFAALVVVLDQFFKQWVVQTIEIHGKMDLIPGIIGITHEQNSGAAFSMLSDQRWLLVGISFLATIVLIFILLRYTEGFWGSIGLAAVLGGTVGNLIDRVFQGHVVDMFDPLFMDFAIFNIADTFLTLGFATFCIHFIISSVKLSKREKQLSASDSAEEADTGEETVIADDKADDPYSMYDVPSRQEIPDFADFQVSDGTAAVNDEPDFTVPPEFFEPDSNGQDYDQSEPGLADETAFDIDDLAALESELGSIDDYDADELLRKYGFEDDSDDQA